MAPVTPRVELAIGSRFENIDLVQIVVKVSLQQLRLDDDTSHWIGMAVREAVANAIKHGNRQDPDKKVEVTFGIEDGDVVIEVRDEGPGFDPAGLPDPLEPENLLKPGGRGIFFMRKFMDGIDYDFRPEGGTVVRLRKHLEASAPAEREEDGSK